MKWKIPTFLNILRECIASCFELRVLSYLVQHPEEEEQQQEEPEQLEQECSQLQPIVEN